MKHELACRAGGVDRLLIEVTFACQPQRTTQRPRFLARSELPPHQIVPALRLHTRTRKKIGNEDA